MPFWVAPLLLLTILAATLLPADARALSGPELRCQRAANGGAERYFKSSAKAAAECRLEVASTGIGNLGDCRSQSDMSPRLVTLISRIDDKISDRCDELKISKLRIQGDCVGPVSASELGACVRARVGRAIDTLDRSLFGSSALVSDSAARCLKSISRQSQKYARNAAKRLRQCKKLAGQDRLPLLTICEEEPDTAAQITASAAAATKRIAARCSGDDLAELAFGAPCTDVTDAATTATCALAAARSAGSGITDAAHDDGGFCNDSFPAVDSRIDELLEALSLEEKVQQMHGSDLLPQDGVFLTPTNGPHGIPGFGMIDGARGVSKGAGNGTAFPVGIARGASWNLDLEERVGEAIGREVRARGASVVLAPVTTVIRHPRWGRSQETYGEDPHHIGRMGTAFVHGAQQHVIASAKHYAVNSIEDTRLNVDVTVDERSLREIFLPHFRRVVEEGKVGSIMSAYNSVNGQFCDENPHLLRDILKGDMGFRGFVESDWVFGSTDTVTSALGGLDIEMPFASIYGGPLVAAVNAGDVPESIIDDAVRAILRTKICFQLDTAPPVADPAEIETPEHIALALEAAQESIVLLKNAGAPLPFDRDTIGTIAVVGPLADVENIGDNGSSDVAPSYIVTALEGIQAAAGPATIVHVIDHTTLAGQTALAAADAVVIAAGFTAADEGESIIGAGDRDTYNLAAAQEQLILDVAALNPATVVVLYGGSAVGVEAWIDEVEGLLMAWYPGMEGGNAIADILFGDINPSGRLPLIVAASESDLPAFDNVSLSVTYDAYHGYRLQDRDSLTPRFPFGFGLSYTTFGYSNISLERSTIAGNDILMINFDITNNGLVAGVETPQVYISYDSSAVDRPLLDLKGFTQVALAPGASQTVSVEIPVSELAYYDVVTSKWITEEIDYAASVGPSSRDLPLVAPFTVSN
jgi:beta-glucosidase